MRWYLDTQLYSYLANGTVRREDWEAALAGRELWLSPVTAYELLEGALQSSPHTYPMSMAAIDEARRCALRIIAPAGMDRDAVHEWITCLPAAPRPGGAAGLGRVGLPRSFFEFRERVTRGRAQFLAQIRGFMAECCLAPFLPARAPAAGREAKPAYRRIGDPLFSAEWQAAAGRAPGEHLDAAFVFHTSVLDRAMRIRYNPDKHPSDFLDYLQLTLLNDPAVAFVTADRRLARAVTRSLQSDRIYLWEELAAR